jgi:hypothetical protein
MQRKMRDVRYSYLGLVLATLLGYAMASQDLKGSAMDVDQFHWGEPACEGLAVGIAVEKNAPTEPVVYHVALGNRSTSPRLLTLFSMLSGLYRVRVIGRQGAVEEGAPALYSHLQISNPQVKITEILAPGQVFQRRGDPTTFRGQLSGTGTLQIVFSSLTEPRDASQGEDHWCHAKSAEVEVEFYPVGRDGQLVP